MIEPPSFHPPVPSLLTVRARSFLWQAEKDGAAATSGLSGRSYLTLILPQAMVCCLEAHGTDKFAEVIWR